MNEQPPTFHAFDVDYDADMPHWHWASCACGWMRGPYRCTNDARVEWLEHLRPALRASA